jgi:hypothetical protein
MNRVIGQVVTNVNNEPYVIINRQLDTKAFPSQMTIGGKLYDVEGVGFFQDHEIWEQQGEKKWPGWIKGTKVTLTEKGSFTIGTKVTVKEDDPLPELKAAPLVFLPKDSLDRPIDMGLPHHAPPLPLDNSPLVEP